MLEDAADGGCDVTWGSNWFSRNLPDAEMEALLNAMYVNLIDAMAAG